MPLFPSRKSALFSLTWRIKSTSCGRAASSHLGAHISPPALLTSPAGARPPPELQLQGAPHVPERGSSLPHLLAFPPAVQPPGKLLLPQTQLRCHLLGAAPPHLEVAGSSSVLPQCLLIPEPMFVFHTRRGSSWRQCCAQHMAQWLRRSGW